MFVATLHLDLPFVCVGVQEVYWGVLLRTRLRRHQGNRTGRWKKLNCNIAVQSLQSSRLISQGTLELGWPFRVVQNWSKGATDFGWFFGVFLRIIKLTWPTHSFISNSTLEITPCFKKSKIWSNKNTYNMYRIKTMVNRWFKIAKTQKWSGLLI